MYGLWSVALYIQLLLFTLFNFLNKWQKQNSESLWIIFFCYYFSALCFYKECFRIFQKHENRRVFSLLPFLLFALFGFLFLAVLPEATADHAASPPGLHLQGQTPPLSTLTHALTGTSTHTHTLNPHTPPLLGASHLAGGFGQLLQLLLHLLLLPVLDHHPLHLHDLIQNGCGC